MLLGLTLVLNTNTAAVDVTDNTENNTNLNRSTDIWFSMATRAYDNNYSPPWFKGIAYPDLYIHRNDYNYIHSRDTNSVVNTISYEAKD